MEKDLKPSGINYQGVEINLFKGKLYIKGWSQYLISPNWP
jgi:hypothetical protein